MLFFLLLLYIEAYASQPLIQSLTKVYYPVCIETPCSVPGSVPVKKEVLFFAKSDLLKNKAVLFVEKELQALDIAGKLICWKAYPFKNTFKCYVKDLNGNVVFVEKIDNKQLTKNVPTYDKVQIDDPDILNMCNTVQSFFRFDKATGTCEKEFSTILCNILIFTENTESFDIQLFHDKRFSKEFFFQWSPNDSDIVRHKKIHDWVKTVHYENGFIVRNGRHCCTPVEQQFEIYTLLFPEMNMTKESLANRNFEEKKISAIEVIKRSQGHAFMFLKRGVYTYSHVIENLDYHINKSSAAKCLSFEDCVQFFGPYEKIFFPALFDKNKENPIRYLTLLLKILIVKLINTTSFNNNNAVKNDLIDQLFDELPNGIKKAEICFEKSTNTEQETGYLKKIITFIAEKLNNKIDAMQENVSNTTNLDTPQNESFENNLVNDATNTVAAPSLVNIDVVENNPINELVNKLPDDNKENVSYKSSEEDTDHHATVVVNDADTKPLPVIEKKLNDQQNSATPEKIKILLQEIKNILIQSSIRSKSLILLLLNKLISLLQ